MTRKIFMFIMFSLSFISFCYADENITVTASGTGRTMTAARIDARRNAAKKALGFIMDSSSRLSITNQNTKLEEDILLVTRGIIEGHEEEIEAHEDKEHNLFTVTICVSVRGDELLRGLIRRGPEKYLSDGAALVANAMRREQMKRESAAAITELLKAIPVGDYVSVNSDNGENFDIRTETLKLNLNLTFDREKYFNEAVPSIVSVLDYVAEARIVDVPFMLAQEESEDGTVTLNPSLNISTMKEYRRLMDIENGNRSIVDSGYVNIYVQTRNFYFNAYRISHEAFEELVKNLFSSEGRNNFMKMNGNAELNINITGKNGINVFSVSAPVTDMQMHNIMYFMNTDDSPFHYVSDNISDEKRSALFILPAFGSNYGLYQKYSLEVLPFKVSADNLIGGYIKSSVVFK